MTLANYLVYSIAYAFLHAILPFPPILIVVVSHW